MRELFDEFPAIAAAGPWVRHAFVRRIPGVDLSVSKSEVLQNQAPWHEAAVAALGFAPDSLWTAEQVHGADVARVPTGGAQSEAVNGMRRWIPAVDGLMTNVPGEILGIHVADCGPVFLVDPVKRAVALLHSGKKGTEGRIVVRAIEAMHREFGSNAADLVVQLGPCIRPPHYEVDFAAQILADAAAAGVPAHQIHDCAVCTHADAERYYSYRRDKGKTGRLLALLGIAQNPIS